LLGNKRLDFSPPLLLQAHDILLFRVVSIRSLAAEKMDVEQETIGRVTLGRRGQGCNSRATYVLQA